MLPLSHTHDLGLGKAMEERPPAKRFCSSVTTNGHKVFTCDFEGCRGDISSVTLPDGMEKVGDHSHRKHVHLNSLTLPNSVKIVGECAFELCIPGVFWALNCGMGVRTPPGYYARGGVHSPPTPEHQRGYPHENLAGRLAEAPGLCVGVSPFAFGQPAPIH